MILIADDHGLYREVIKVVLEKLGTTTILTAGDYTEVETILESPKAIKLLLLDLRMPGMHGIDSVAKIARLWPEVPILVVSASDNLESIKSCLDAGAAGFVSKVNDVTVLQAAIEQVLAGQCFFPTSVVGTSTLKFSQKQIEILHCLVDGCSNHEISERTFLSEGTVKQYISDILSKMEVTNRVQAATRAREILGIGS